MSQPIKKSIIEEKKTEQASNGLRTLVIDGNSMLFMSFADKTLNNRGVHIGGIYQFLIQLRMMLSKFHPDNVYCFFDNEYSGLLRWKIYPDYKANRDKHYEAYGDSGYWREYNERLHRMQSYIKEKNSKKNNKSSQSSNWDKLIEDNFDRERNSLMRYFEELFIRVYMDEVVEGDDLISYYCLNKYDNEKIIIMSGDMDLTQLLSEDIAIYNLSKKKFITTKNFKDEFGYHYKNVLLRKVLCGDSSDNIGNIKGLSEEGLSKMIPDIKNREVTLTEVKAKAKEINEDRKKNKKKPLKLYENIVNGVSNKEYNGDFFEINDSLINLKRPLLTDEAKEVMDSMIHAPIDPEDRSFSNLYRMITDDGITELSSDTKFSGFFRPFKELVEKETKIFKDSQKN